MAFSEASLGGHLVAFPDGIRTSGSRRLQMERTVRPEDAVVFHSSRHPCFPRATTTLYSTVYVVRSGVYDMILVGPRPAKL